MICYAEDEFKVMLLKKYIVLVKNGKEDVYHQAEIHSAFRHEVHMKCLALGDTESIPQLNVLIIDESRVEVPVLPIC